MKKLFISQPMRGRSDEEIMAGLITRQKWCIVQHHSWTNVEFQKAIDNCSTKLYDNADVVKSWFTDGGKYEYDVALSDIISALSKAKLNDYLVAGHSAEYWEDKSLVCMELLANINSIEVLGYESLVEIKKMFPELYDAYKGVVR